MFRLANTDTGTDAIRLQTHFVGVGVCVGVGQCEHSIILVILSENCMKLKTIAPRGMARPFPLIQRRITMNLKISIFPCQYFHKFAEFKGTAKKQLKLRIIS